MATWHLFGNLNKINGQGKGGFKSHKHLEMCDEEKEVNWMRKGGLDRDSSGKYTCEQRFDVV